MLNLTIYTPKVVIFYEEKNDLLFTYICPIVGICGFFLHSLSFMVFSKSDFKELLYKYLKMESLNVLFDLLITALKPIYYCRSCEVSKTYFAQIYFISFIVYGASIFELSAIINRILSTFCCYILIRNKIIRNKYFFVLNYYKIINFTIYTISSLIFLYQIFIYKITDVSVDKISPFYIIEKTDFSKTSLKSIFELTGFIFRDGINLAILIFINILIFIRFKNDLSKKKIFLMPINSNTKITLHHDELVIRVKNLPHVKDLKAENFVNKRTGLLNRIKKCENKQTIMIFTTCICCMIGRLPILVFFILRNFDNENKYQDLIKLAALSIYLTYVVNFFLYYNSNKRFKKGFINICSKFFENILNLSKFFKINSFK